MKDAPCVIMGALLTAVLWAGPDTPPMPHRAARCLHDRGRLPSSFFIGSDDD